MAKSRDGRAAILRRLVIALALCLTPASAISADPDPSPPAKVRQFLDLQNDGEVRAYLDQHPTPPAEPPPPAVSWYATLIATVGERLGTVREHFAGLADTVPHLPDELDRAENIFIAEFEDSGLLHIGRFFVLFVALGIVAEQIYNRIMRPARTWLLALRLDSVTERVRAVFARFAYGLGVIVSFTLGSIGAFLMINWPPLLKEILLGYLFAQFVLRLAFAVERLLLAPGAERFRVVPISTPAASFLFPRLALMAGLIAFGEVTISLLGTFGFSLPSRDLIEFCLTGLVLCMAIEIVWRYPRSAPAPRLDGTPDPARLRSVWTWLATAYFVLLWLLWASGASGVFWLAAFAVGMPGAIRLTHKSVDHILRPPGRTDSADDGARSVEAVVLERGARAAIIILGALFLAHVWGIDLVALTMHDTLGTRLIRGALNAVMIVLIADFVWHVASAVIDRRLAATLTPQGGHLVDGRNSARMKTLLPILKNLLLVLIMALAGMMILSALGLEIGPLIASAGVIGVAIGFGAQTLVRDIFSGIFYLFDDAFRVGEYIQSGTYKGTVKSFSLRSIKLRHHRGSLFTVPFGVLGAIQNLSRDWVIDKMTIGVSYDADLDQVRKIIKGIGARLKADPELAHDIIEPLKMQGVEQLGEYAVQIRMKMMTKPGDVQFIARRRALGMIKAEFKAHGIAIALPAVQVSSTPAGLDDELSAGAHAALRMAAAAPRTG